ncbi:uncharacterized protein Bfra_008514 [Botrytis fragariae]|uniref:Uncharacterized protein n=1 Tax=Botrytis fragariae TaxID=1964551 RepID=A0A8H6AT94_9HELO|nr:uncharacterized protein Bfra_008514 [Botrytis fragariae]KAF5873234.1 hypothetical protein Bfra_008514 [Botrytis fragariae]
MEIHRKFTDKVKTHPKYFQIFLVVLVVAFIITILVVGSLSEPSRLLQLYAPSEEFDLYKVYFFTVCRSKIDGINDGCHGYLPAVLSDDAFFAGFPNLRIIFALFFLSGLAHLAHGFFGIKVHLNHLHHPKIENAMAFMSFFTLLAAAIACPWILIDYRWQIQSVSEDKITVDISTSVIGLGFTAVLFSLVSREILIVGTLKNERAIQTFSVTPENGENARRYSLDDGDSRPIYNEEAERSQIPVPNIREEEFRPITREYPASMQMPMPLGTRMAQPPAVYAREPQGPPFPPPPPGAYVTRPSGPPPPTFAGYGRGSG